jgi:hypothetical protein
MKLQNNNHWSICEDDDDDDEASCSHFAAISGEYRMV